MAKRKVRSVCKVEPIVEKKSVREAVFFMHNINDCIETIVKQVDNEAFRNSLFMHVSYPLRMLLNNWDEWHDLEKGYNTLLREKMTI